MRVADPEMATHLYRVTQEAVSNALRHGKATRLEIGLANVGLLAPIPLQLVHLVMADAVWVMLVLLGANVMATRDTSEVAPVPARA